MVPAAVGHEIRVAIAESALPDSPDESGTYQRGDLARAALGLVASTQESFRRGAKMIAGINAVSTTRHTGPC
ncbi:hypothetical protein ACFQ68_07665 [Amycolatopsis japonica]|uniref:hypothetical protein n=1 Tax=Amycolatopsis japonica TaxID=208439 RepID=UPI003672244D